MAQIVMAAGSSHTPMVSMSAEDWSDYALGDRRNRGLLDVDGSLKSFDDLVAKHGTEFLSVITQEHFNQQERTVKTSLDRLAEGFDKAKPDVVIIVGDDQDEMFSTSSSPTMALFWGKTIEMGPRHGRDDLLGDRYPNGLPRWVNSVAEGQAIDAPHFFPGAPEFGHDLLADLVANDFDLASITEAPADRKFGHAFGFIIHRLLGDGKVPVVPIFLNTFYKPNQPSPARCFALGKALRQAILAHPSDLRVAVIASGGLSHFVVDEELDRQVLTALEQKDAQTLCTLPLGRLNSGTSEIRNWITVGAVAQDLNLEWKAYEAAVRTPAGTGCGLGFVQWS